jgi:hypothetical protein
LDIGIVKAAFANATYLPSTNKQCSKCRLYIAARQRQSIVTQFIKLMRQIPTRSIQTLNLLNPNFFPCIYNLTLPNILQYQPKILNSQTINTISNKVYVMITVTFAAL